LYLQEAGFSVLETFPYSISAFLIREHPLFYYAWNSLFFREIFKKIARNTMRKAPQWMRKRYGHMLMYICTIS